MQNLTNNHWWFGFFDFFIVVAFGIGWLILEWRCRKIDRWLAAEKQKEAARSETASDTSAPL